MQDLLSCDRESANTENRNSEIWNNYYLWPKKPGFEHLAEKVFEIAAKFIQQKIFCVNILNHKVHSLLCIWP